MLHLKKVGMGSAVGSQQAVEAEIPVVGLVAEIASVCPVFARLQCEGLGVTRQRAVDRFGYALVHPVPDGRTSYAAVAIDDIPVFLQISHRIAHGVGIFPHDHGFLAFLLRFSPQVFRRGIAEVMKCGIDGISIVERKTGGIELTDLVIHRLNIRTDTALIAQTPKDYAWMILIALHE